MPHNLTILMPQSEPPHYARTRQLTEEELDQELLLPFLDKWPNAQWYAVEFSYDQGESWEILNLFPLQVIGNTHPPQ